jgi:hypothetical protein
MQIGPAMLMTDGQLVGLLSLLEAISSLGVHTSSPLSLSRAQKLNIEQWPTPPQKSFGYSRSYESLELGLLQLQDFGVIILEQPTCQQTPSFMLEQSTLKSTIHFVRERVAQKLLHVQLIGTGDQVADGFTKPLTVRKLEELKNNLNLRSPG